MSWIESCALKTPFDAWSGRHVDLVLFDGLGMGCCEWLPPILPTGLFMVALDLMHCSSIECKFYSVSTSIKIALSEYT